MFDTKTRWMSLLLLLPLLAHAACSRQQEGGEDLRITVVFHDASGLQVGDEVRLGGLKVGAVEKIEITTRDRVDVHVVVQAAYRSVVTRDAEIRIQKEGLVSRQRYLELEPGTEAPVRDGEELAGIHPLGVRLSDWFSETKEILQSPDVRHGMREFAEAVERAAARGKEEWEAQRPLLEKKAMELYETARKEAPEVAARIKKEIDRLLEEIEEEFSE